MSAFYIKAINCVFVHIPKTGGISIRIGLFDGAVEGPVQGREEWHVHWPRDRVFAFVRHPLDRFVSGLHYCECSAEEALAWLKDDRLGQRPIRANKPEWVRHHLLPQTHAYNQLDRVVYIGAFERLQESFAEVAEYFNFPHAELPHMNATHHRLWEAEIPADLLAEVVDYYRLDFLTFDYAMPEEAASGGA